MPFRGFIVQMGKCLYLCSDIGTTFMGAHHELREFSALEAHQPNLLEFKNSGTLIWHFIPPHLPHLGDFGRLK
jgi:hypothetical protein